LKKEEEEDDGNRLTAHVKF